jgi:hypothetical protein
VRYESEIAPQAQFLDDERESSRSARTTTPKNRVLEAIARSKSAGD